MNTSGSNSSDPTPAEWIAQWDEKDRQGRIERLAWVVERHPADKSGFVFYDGITSSALFEEAKSCFVLGQYRAVIMLGMAFIERTLSSRLHAAGNNEVTRKSGRAILEAAREGKWITPGEFDQLDEVRERRNPVVHYRRPGEVEFRAIEAKRDWEELIEDDARLTLLSALHIFGRCGLSGGGGLI